MNINEQKILNYLDKFRNASDIEIYNNKIPNNEISISLSDRPKYTIGEGNIGNFFLDYEKRCSFLESIIGISAKDEIKNMINFINNRVDNIDIYHYSFLPKKIENTRISFGKYNLISLKEESFNKLLLSHEGFNYPHNSLDSFRNHCSIFISKENAKRINPSSSYHLFFDTLDNIYSNHTISEFALDFYFGEIDRQFSSRSTDNFPFANSSGSTNFYPSILSFVNTNSLKLIETIVDYFQNKLFYRLIVSNEINAHNAFEKSVLLRTLLEPFFKKISQLSIVTKY